MVQLDFFDLCACGEMSACGVKQRRRRGTDVGAVSESLDRVRKGLFARYGEVSDELACLRLEVSALRGELMAMAYGAVGAGVESRMRGECVDRERVISFVCDATRALRV